VIFDTTNAAFGDNFDLEVTRVLHEVIIDVVSNPDASEWSLSDVNGNLIGIVKLV
jgi:hypothetical protein